MSTPKQKIKKVVAVLRRMALHGCADQVENAFDEAVADLKANHERIDGAFRAENVRLKTEFKRLKIRIHGQRAAIRDKEKEIAELRAALECVHTRLRVFCRDGLSEPQKRWIDETQSLAHAHVTRT